MSKKLDFLSGCLDDGIHIFNGTTNICIHCHKSHDSIELKQLREMVRWRDYPNEPPTENGRYLVRTTGGDLCDHVSHYSPKTGWTSSANIIKWLPIP